MQIIHQFLGDFKERDFKVDRNNVRILLKYITEDIHPIPNHTRHEWERWDAFILVSDPDALFAEFQSRGLEFHETLTDTNDGLRVLKLI